jgi:hypothetical protein
MYKKILERLDKINSLDNVLNFYAGSLFRMRNGDHYELIFNNQFNSPVIIPKLTADDIRLSPYFYLDDDECILDVDKMLILVVMDRLEYFRRSDYKYIHHKFLRKDVSKVLDGLMKIEPVSYNNRLKIEHRIRIVKTFRQKNNKKEYYDCIGRALWESAIPKSEEDIRKYSKLFNDPIRVDELSEGIYCNLFGKQIQAAGYSSTDNAITSIYEPKSSLPERLRLHYTSELLQPLEPEQDHLFESNNKEKINAYTVFIPITTDKTEDQSPLGKFTLSVGEILINKQLAEKEFFVRRTFMTPNKDVILAQKGDVLNPGDIIAYDLEGFPAVIYDINYKGGVIEDIIPMYNSYKIIVKIVAKMGVARLISDYGLKGVTHPREDLGYIIPPKQFGKDKIPVQMVIGPTSLKSGHNGIKMSWLNFVLSENGPDDSITLNANDYPEDEVNIMCQELQQVDWVYMGKTYKVYFGLMSFGVTDLSNDCKSNGVRVMQETMKYMYNANNHHLEKAANLIYDNYINGSNKGILKQLLKLRSFNRYNDGTPVYQWDDPVFQDKISRSYFNPSSWSVSYNTNNILLNPFNQGFYVKYENRYIRFPSFNIIEQMTYVGAGTVTYPQFVTFSQFILMTLRKLYKREATKEQLLENLKKYIFYINHEIFSKRAALSQVTSPELPGGNLKQLASVYVPRRTTVVLDQRLIKQIQAFKKQTGLKRIYEIGVRNPVIWRFQFHTREVLTLNQFAKYLKKEYKMDINQIVLPEYTAGAVLRNTIDILLDKSDTDGDLYPIAVPLHQSIQQELAKYSANPDYLLGYEKRWITQYIKSEISKNEKFLDVEEKPFKYYEISRDKFADILADAAIAKTRIGMGTVDLWRIHTAIEWMYANGNINKHKMMYLQHITSRILQDTVIEGVKHIEGGASGYDVFALSNFGEEQVELIKPILTNMLDMTPEDADLYLQAMKLAKEDKTIITISRIHSGGDSEYIAGLVDNLNNIDDNHLSKIGYCKIIRPYINDILESSSVIEEIDEEEAEFAEEDVDY